MDKKKTIQLTTIFAILIAVVGGTLAYWQWTTSEEQNTNVTFTVTQDFSCSADGGGNITQSSVKLAPTDCTDTSRAIKRKVTVSPVLDRDNLTVSLDLWLNVHELGEGLKKSNNFRYVLTTSSNSCEEGTIISEGNFRGRESEDKIKLITNDLHTVTETEEYWLYIWLDKEETNSNTMNQKFNLSLGGVCDEVETLVGDAYALFVDEEYNDDFGDLPLYDVIFVRSENPLKVGDTYNGRKISKVYTDFEGDKYLSGIMPWSNTQAIYKSVTFEDTIRPISTAGWFDMYQNMDGRGIVDDFSMDIAKLDTSQVTNMYAMFAGMFFDENAADIDLSTFDTSNVVDMTGMFEDAVNFIGMSNWDVSNVRNMSYMFYSASINDIDLSNWDISNVVNYNEFFDYENSESLDWENVYFSVYSEDDNSLRLYSNIGSTEIPAEGTIYDGRIVTKVNNISLNEEPIRCSTLDVTKIIVEDNMVAPDYTRGWFGGCKKANYIDVSKLDTSNVRQMYYMFQNVGSDPSVTNMTLIGIEEFDTSRATEMNEMFSNFGLNANYALNLNNWNVLGVTTHNRFDYGVETKIIDPLWND